MIPATKKKFAVARQSFVAPLRSKGTVSSLVGGALLGMGMTLCGTVSITEPSVEQYYNTVIVIDYQLQIPLHFCNTVKTEPCEYYFNLLN